MQIPLQISFRNMDPSDAVSARVRERVTQLEKYCEHIISCRVMIDEPHRRHHTGNLFHVRIDIKVPGKELVVDRDPSQHTAHKDAYVAIRDAFDAAERELQTYVRTRRHEIKTPVLPPHAWISRLFRNEDYGFISTQDGREIYFHRNSVLNQRYDSLEIGTEVRFSEEMGEAGPQASSVDLVGKMGKHTPTFDAVAS